MGKHDLLVLQSQQKQSQQLALAEPMEERIPGAQNPAASSSAMDPGLMVPVTPPRDYIEIESSRLPA